jgi:hypothetical protein
MRRTALPAMVVLVFTVLPTPEVAGAQSCPMYQPIPGGEGLGDVRITKPARNNCQVTAGSYILRGSVLTIEASGYAQGRCEVYWSPTCQLLSTYERYLHRLDAWSFTQQELQRAVPITYDSSGVHDHHFHVILADEDGPDSSCY